MSVLEHKIDFAVLVTAANANPNGDPLNGNRPRENYDSCGEISDVCGRSGTDCRTWARMCMCSRKTMPVPMTLPI